MHFVSITDGRRVEAFDIAVLARAYEALEARNRKPIGSVRIGSGRAMFAGADSPMSKIAGLGFTDERSSSPIPSVEAFNAAESLFFDQGAPAQVELSSLADPSLLPVLTERGYAPVGFEYVCGLRLDDLNAGEDSDDASHLRVVQVNANEWSAWLDVIVNGFSVPDTEGIASHESFTKDALQRSIGDFAATEGMRHYLGTRHVEGTTVSAGAAGLLLIDDVGMLCGAATLPEHRGMGVQTALLRHRIAEAAKAGCRLLVVTTQPGSTSLKNVQKHGFELLYVRLVLVKPAPLR